MILSSRCHFNIILLFIYSWTDVDIVDKRDHRQVYLLLGWLCFCSRTQQIHSFPFILMRDDWVRRERDPEHTFLFSLRLMLSRVYLPVLTQATHPLLLAYLGWAALSQGRIIAMLWASSSRVVFMPLLLLHEIAMWQSILVHSLCTVAFMSRPGASDCSWCFCRSSLWVFGSWVVLSISF